MSKPFIYLGLFVFYAKVNTGNAVSYSERERADMLINLFEKGIINREQLLLRLPEGMINDIETLISEKVEEVKE